MKISYVEHSVYSDLSFEHPSKFYIIDALQRRVYIHCRSREDAVEWVDSEYGKKYNLRCTTMGKSSGKETAFGRINAKSRAGMRKPT
jgi:hypothetical protein